MVLKELKMSGKSRAEIAALEAGKADSEFANRGQEKSESVSHGKNTLELGQKSFEYRGVGPDAGASWRSNDSIRSKIRNTVLSENVL